MNVKAKKAVGEETSMLAERPKSGRDAKREAILAVARDVFLTDGYAAASMSSIAARLGGSKGTLYNYFRSKEELFQAYVAQHCAWQSEAMFALLADTQDVRKTLINLGERYLGTVLSDANMQNFRLIVAEAQRYPEIGRIFYETGPLAGIRRLAHFLEKAIERGEIAADDPIEAARTFLSLCSNDFTKARLCNYMPAPSPEQIRTRVAVAVRVFLAAYAPDA